MTGEELKREREKLGLTQHELAELIGVAENTVWRWEAGQRIPHPVVQRAVETVLAEQSAKVRKRRNG